MLSAAIQAAEVKTKIVDGGKNLNIQIGSIQNKITLQVPEKTELDAEPLVYGSDSYSLIVLQYSDFEAGTSVVYAINEKAQKLWSIDLGAFNPSQPLIEKEYVYLSAIGRVWKLHKQSGKVAWSHKDLYKNKSFEFNGAEPISRRGKFVLFSKKLKVNDSTGEIVEVK